MLLYACACFALFNIIYANPIESPTTLDNSGSGECKPGLTSTCADGFTCYQDGKDTFRNKMLTY